MAIHIKNRLPHSPVYLKKLPYQIMFSTKPSIKYLYTFDSNAMYMYAKKNRLRCLNFELETSNA
jgi:hypothetical protein